MSQFNTSARLTIPNINELRTTLPPTTNNKRGKKHPNTKIEVLNNKAVKPNIYNKKQSTNNHKQTQKMQKMQQTHKKFITHKTHETRAPEVINTTIDATTIESIRNDKYDKYDFYKLDENIELIIQPLNIGKNSTTGEINLLELLKQKSIELNKKITAESLLYINNPIAHNPKSDNF
jgi:hypothetical protein